MEKTMEASFNEPPYCTNDQPVTGNNACTVSVDILDFGFGARMFDSPRAHPTIQLTHPFHSRKTVSRPSDKLFGQAPGIVYLKFVKLQA